MSVIHTADREGKKLESFHGVSMGNGRYTNCYDALAELGRNNPQ